jgi:hypothetical protein
MLRIMSGVGSVDMCLVSKWVNKWINGHPGLMSDLKVKDFFSIKNKVFIANLYQYNEVFLAIFMNQNGCLSFSLSLSNFALMKWDTGIVVFYSLECFL